MSLPFRAKPAAETLPLTVLTAQTLPGWLTRAGGREEAARERFLRAAEGFRAWGQPLDALRAEQAAA